MGDNNSEELDESGYLQSIEKYFKDPKRIRTSNIEEFMEYVANRGLAASAVGSVVGAGQGFSAGGMAINLGSASGFKWGMGACMFFSTAYGLRALRERDDLLNFSAAGSINYGIYRAFRLGPRGALTGFVMGAVGGGLYSVCSEELFTGLREMWVQKRRHLLTDNHVIRVSHNRVSPFPPREPPVAPPSKPNA